MNFNSAKSYTLAPGTGGTITLDNGSGPAAVNDAGGTHSITASIILNSNLITSVVQPTDTFQFSGNMSGAGRLTTEGSGTVALSGTNSYSGGTTVAGNLLVNSAASLPASRPLTIQTGGEVQLATGIGGITLSALSIAGTGGLDIKNNHLFINYATGSDPIASIAGYLASGYASGKWNGPGISSSTTGANPAYAIGYADGRDGIVAGLASGQIEVEYTLLGDANLDGAVNGTDFALMAANFNKAVTGWDQGDFDYSGSVNGTDFAYLAANFNQGASGTAISNADALDEFAAANGFLPEIPEPASLELGVLALTLLAPRKHKKSPRPNRATGFNPSLRYSAF